MIATSATLQPTRAQIKINGSEWFFVLRWFYVDCSHWIELEAEFGRLRCDISYVVVAFAAAQMRDCPAEYHVDGHK